MFLTFAATPSAPALPTVAAPFSPSSVTLPAPNSGTPTDANKRTPSDGAPCNSNKTAIKSEDSHRYATWLPEDGEDAQCQATGLSAIFPNRCAVIRNIEKAYRRHTADSNHTAGLAVTYYSGSAIEGDCHKP
jgi:hypothetical protein